MDNTTITFMTDAALKRQASELFDALGMNLSVALNMFLKQAVMKQKYPCSLELDISNDASASYTAGFFELFGCGEGLGFDNEPDDLPLQDKEIINTI